MATSFKTPEKQHNPIAESHTYTISSPLNTLSPSPAQIRKEEVHEASQEKLLKTISSRVKSSIKSNQKVVIYEHTHTEDFNILKKGNAEMQAIIDQFRNRHPNKPHIETPQVVHNNHYQHSQRIEDSTLKNSKGTGKEQEQSPTQAALKRQIMSAINVVILANDEKLCKQQHYIATLERRLAKLERIDSKIDHFKFETAVKLQDSPKKAKNYSLRTPLIEGDRVQEDELEFSPKAAEGEKQNELHFFQNPYKRNRQNEQQHNSTALSQQHALLQEEYSLLKQRLDIEVESRIMVASEIETLLQKIQHLQDENKNLKKEMFDLNERLQFSHQRYSDLQIFLRSYKTRISGKILPNMGPSLSSQVGGIANELKMCVVQRYKVFEGQLSAILIERGSLRAQVKELEKRIIDGCKFSCTHREVFQLREKVRELQAQLEAVQGEIKARQDKIEEEPNNDMAKSPTSVQCLKWPALVYFCVTTAVARLEHIQKQCKNAGKT